MIFRVYVVNSVNKKSIAQFFVAIALITCIKICKKVHYIQSAKTSYLPCKNASPNSVASFVLNAIEFFFYRVYHFSGNIDKTRGSHFEIQRPCYNYLVRGDYSQV